MNLNCGKIGFLSSKNAMRIMSEIYSKIIYSVKSKSLCVCFIFETQIKFEPLLFIFLEKNHYCSR